MITVKSLFFATMVLLGSLGFVGSVGAYYEKKSGEICPVKGDKIRVLDFVDGYGEWFLQVSEDGRLKFDREFSSEPSTEDRTIFSVKEIITLHWPDGKPFECFKLETCNNKELKLIKDSNGYVIEESSEKNKSQAQDGFFKIGTEAWGKRAISCYPNGKIEKTTKIIDGKETERIMHYGIYIQGSAYDDNRGAAVMMGGSGESFEIVFLTEKTSAPQEQSATQGERKTAPENTKEKIVIPGDTITPKIKEENKQLEEMTRKFEEQLEINRKLQQELNNLKAGKSSDTVTIEKESKPAVSNKKPQPSRMNTSRQGARGRAQTQKK